MEIKHKMTETSSAEVKKRKFRFPFGIIALVLILIWIYSVVSRSNLLPDGSKAPAWTLRNVEHDGGMMSLDELKGKTVVLDFWGIGCPPCMQEMFELEAVWREFKDKDVVVVGATAWRESRTAALRTKRKKGVTYPIVLGTPEMIKAYKVESLPTLYILDKNGNIADSHQGFWDRKALKKAVREVASQ